MEIKTIYDLVREYKRNNPNGHYFDRETLKFFGETLSSMYLYKKPIKVTDVCGNTRTVYVISKWQRNHPAGRRKTYDYFDVNTLDCVFV